MTKKSPSISTNLNPRLAAYAALATASLAAPALQNADAAIVSSGPVNILIPVSSAGIYLNVVTNMAGTNAGTPGWDVNPYGSTSLSLFNPTAPTGGVYQGANGNFNLAVGTLVGPGGPFSSGTFGPLNFNSSNNYVGFRFANEVTGITDYGWLQISLGASATDPARAIVGYAYENTGGTINVGQTAIPEPSTFALLGVVALGGVGIRAWRSRKAA